nr:hypothetical protein [Pseudosporangium ferrugineum]
MAGRAGALPDEVLGGLDVAGAGREIQHIAGRPGDDRLLAAEHLAQVGDVALQGVERRGRRAVAPDDVQQPVGADHLAALQGEHGEDRLAAQPVHRPGGTLDGDVDRAEKPDLHCGPPPPVRDRETTGQ